MNLEWQEVLYGIWNDCRKLSRWDLVYECHDEEDRDYFMELDETEEEYEKRNSTGDAR